MSRTEEPRYRATIRIDPRGRVATTALVVAALVFLFALTLFWALEWSAEPTPAPTSDRTDVVADDGPDRSRSAASTTLPERTESSPAGRASTDVSMGGGASDRGDASVRGHVHDAEGRPLAGAVLMWMPATMEDVEPYAHDDRLTGGARSAHPFPNRALAAAIDRARETTTDDHGAYTLALPESLSPSVLIASAPLHAVRLHALDAIAPAGDMAHDFVLPGAGAISGSVLEEGTEAPAAGMEVHVQSIPPGSDVLGGLTQPTIAMALVGTDGVYRVVGLAPGRCRIRPRRGSTDFVSVALSRGATVDAEPGRESTGVDFVVRRGGTVVGTVIDPRGAGIADAKIRIVQERVIRAGMQGDVSQFLDLRLDEHLSDEDGHFEIRGVELAQSHRIQAFASGYAPSEPVPIDLEDGVREATVVLHLTHGSTIHGTAMLPDGTPLPKQTVSLAPSLEDIMEGSALIALLMQDGTTQVVSDERGSFAIPCLAAGTYTLSLGITNQFAVFGGTDGSVDVEVDGIEDVTGVSLVGPDPEVAAARGDAEIRGVVRDDLGRPILDVSIAAASPIQQELPPGVSGRRTARTSSRGEFAIRELAVGRYQIVARQDGYSEVTVSDVPTDEQYIEITMNRLGVISGVVVTADGHPPANPFKVSAQAIDDSTSISKLGLMGLQASPTQWTDGRENGTFELQNVGSGTVEVLVELPGYAPATSGPLTVLPGESLTGVRILVTRGAAVIGRVLLPDGTVVEGAKVDLHSEKPGDKNTEMLRRMLPGSFFGTSGVATAKDGSFRIERVVPGRYAVSAVHPSYAPAREVSVLVRADETVSTPDLVLSLGASIEGKVTVKGEAKAQAMVRCYGTGSPMQTITTDEEGRYVVSRLSPGDYMLTFFEPGGMMRGRGMAMKTHEITVEDDEVVRLDVDLGAGYRVFGRIRGLPGEGISMVMLRRPDGLGPDEVDPLDVGASIEQARHQTGLAILGEDGVFDIPGVEAGTYILEVPRIPANPADLEAYSKMDRTPLVREEIRVEDRDLELDLLAGTVTSR